MHSKSFSFSISLLTLIFLSPLTAQATENNMKSFEIIEKNITKSPNDKRQYQAIRLTNQLEVLLISDPDLKNSAASLSVPIGSMHNPDSQLGLAHYLEHMLFLGSEKYPVINAYSKFMSQNGGYTNAYTAQEATVYGFEVNDNAFAEALDRLADVMRAPLLDEQYAEKERHTVNAEHKINYDNDARKLYALQRYSLNPAHPMSRFSTGDLSTLINKPGSDLQQELESFFKQYYSANLMKVALTSPRSIEDMQTIAVKYLTQIPNSNASIPTITAPLLTSEQRAVEIQIKPTADLKFLQIHFLVPSLKDEYMYQPGGYINRLLGSDHKGGLSDYLKNRGLTESVSSGFNTVQSDEYSQFSITFKLTEKGLLEQDSVIASLFAYIDLIKEKGVNEQQYSEQKKSLENYFQFLPKNAGFNYVMGLSATMLKGYPLPDVLSYPFRLDGFKAAFIQQVLGYLTPENSRLFLMSPDATVEKDIPFYQGQYSQSKIVSDRLQAWLSEASNIQPKMTLPSNNKWLPEDLSVVIEDENKKALHLIDQPGISVWTKQSTLNEPKGIYKLQLNNNINDRSPKDRIKMSLLLDIIRQQLSDLTFSTQEAGLGFSVGSKNGLLINVNGYSDKQSQLLLVLLDHIQHLKIDEQTLNLSKQALKRRLENKAKSKPMDIALDGFSKIIRQPAWSDDTLLNQIDKITNKDLLTLVDDIFSQSTLRLLALGNFSTAEVLAITEQLKTKIKIVNTDFYKAKKFKATPQQGSLNFVRHSDKEDDALASIYLVKSEGAISLAKAELLNKLLKPAFYNQIRTQEQLTYSPFTANFELDDSIAFGLFTQSPAIGTAALYDRFRAFLESFKVALMETTQRDFEEIKHAHIANYLTKPSGLNSEFSYLNREWMDNKESIDTKQEYVEILESVSLKQVQEYYLTLFFNSEETQQILVQVKGKSFKEKLPLVLPKQITISNIDELVK